VEASIQHDRQRRKISLQALHDFVAERRNLAILLRRESLQHGVSRMHDEYIATCALDEADKIAYEAVVVIAIETDPMLDRHRQRHRIAHRLDAIRDECGLAHQTRAEAAGLDALRRTAAIQIDLVVTPAPAQPRGVRELRRIAAAQL